MVAAALPELIGPSYSWDTPLTKEPLTDGILSRIRSVSLTFDEALSPDSVRKAVRSMGNRASMAPLAVAGSAVNPYNRWALKFSWLRPIAPVSVRHAAHGRGLLPETWDRNPFIAAVGSGLAAGSDLVYGGSTIGDHATSSSSSTAVHSFSRTLPPPHRVLLLVALGLFCWWANLRGLRRLGLEISPASSSSRNTASSSAEDRSAVPMSNLSSSVGALSSSATSPPLPAGSHMTSASVEPFTSSAGRPAAQTSVSTSSSSPALERRVLSFALIYFLWAMAGWLTYRIYVDLLAGDPKGRHAQVLQGITVLGAVALAVWPGEFAAKWTRVDFGRHLLHLLRPTLAQGPTFPDVLLADILTSFAKVLGDVWLTACFLLPRRNHHEWWNGRGSLIVPCLATLPYLIRFRQCIAEYLVSAPVPGSNASSGRSTRPLANALKYASAFPVIWLSALQDSTAGTESSPDGVKGVYGLWLLAVFVNSFFSFWWDVTNDWGLDMLRPSAWPLPRALGGQGVQFSTSGYSLLPGTGSTRSAPTFHRRGLSSLPVGTVPSPNESDLSSDLQPKEMAIDHQSSVSVSPSNSSTTLHRSVSGSNTSQKNFLRPPSLSSSSQAGHHRRRSSMLRPASKPMLFHPWVYHLSILLDLLLRFTWSLKLSSHLHHIVELEAGVFFLEGLEIVRRCAWVFLRVEWEEVKRGSWNRRVLTGSARHAGSGSPRSDMARRREDHKDDS